MTWEPMFLWYFLLAGLGADAFIPDLDCLNVQLFINIFFSGQGADECTKENVVLTPFSW